MEESSIVGFPGDNDPIIFNIAFENINYDYFSDKKTDDLGKDEFDMGKSLLFIHNYTIYEPGSLNIKKKTEDKDFKKIFDFFKNQSFDIYHFSEDPINKVDVEQKIIDYFKLKKHKYIIYYTGNGNKDGNWSFTDNDLSIEELINLYETYCPFVKFSDDKYCNNSELVIISDCSYSGNWMHKLCEYKSKKSLHINMITSCDIDQISHKNFLFDRIFLKKHLELKTKKKKNNSIKKPTEIPKKKKKKKKNIIKEINQTILWTRVILGNNMDSNCKKKPFYHINDYVLTSSKNYEVTLDENISYIFINFEKKSYIKYENLYDKNFLKFISWIIYI